MKIGIIGGGQLGRMVALAGFPLGHTFRIWTDSKDLATSDIAEQVIGPFHDPGLVSKFCDGLDAVTYEWENVPFGLAKDIADRVPFFFPNLEVLSIVQDRLDQKVALEKLKIPLAPFFAVRTLEELKAAVSKMGLPAVLKTCRMGYDGKGQAVLKKKKDLDLIWKAIGDRHLVLERFVKFEKELSLVAVRGRDGKVAFYPLVENFHQTGILRVTWAPAIMPVVKLKKLQAQAEKIAKTFFKKYNYVGVMTIEFFLYRGKLLVNEVATRVHNSGHWTIEGAATSQFENHVRAGTGMPLGSTRLTGPTAMINILGKLPDSSRVLKVQGAHLHLYGKTESPKRKIGHISVLAKTTRELKVQVRKIQKLLP